MVCKTFPPIYIPRQKITDSMMAKLQAMNPRMKYMKGKPSP
jgi:hypothetical protein